jgi:hypothetical protein
MPTSADSYEFLKKHLKKDPAKIIKNGTSSFDYARRVCKNFTLVCEMPYYYDPRIEDTSESDITRKEAVLYGLTLENENYNFIKKKYTQMRLHLRKIKSKKPFRDSIEEFLRRFPDQNAAQKHWAETDQTLNRKATVAEKFDSCVVSRFYALLISGMLYRCVKATGKEEVEKEVFDYITELNQELEKQLSYKVIPIRSLVKVQLGSALITADYIDKKR